MPRGGAAKKRCVTKERDDQHDDWFKAQQEMSAAITERTNKLEAVTVVLARDMPVMLQLLRGALTPEQIAEVEATPEYTEAKDNVARAVAEWKK
jgi:hypothetical protein